MDLVQRLNQLESVRDWQGLVGELQNGIAAEESSAVKAAYHLKLGRVLEEKFLQGVKALKHYQDAFKLNPALLEALDRARSVYWDLGKTHMVQKLLDRQVKMVAEGPTAVSLLVELADVLTEAGEYDQATAAYARALGVSGGQDPEARAGLQDSQVEAAEWSAHVDSLVSEARRAEGAAAAQLFLRAMRIAKRYAPEDVQRLAEQAYKADPFNKQAAAVYETLLVDANAAATIAVTQQGVLDDLEGLPHAKVAFVYGARWAVRHQDVDRASALLEEALQGDPTNEAAFNFLRELWGSTAGDWTRVMSLAERAASDGADPFMVAQAGAIAWEGLKDVTAARGWYDKLATIAPEHPSLRAFEEANGHAAPAGAASEALIEVGADVEVEIDAGGGLDAPEPAVEAAVEEPAAPVAVEATPEPAPVSAPPVSTPPVSAAPASAPATKSAASIAPKAAGEPASAEHIAELLAKAEKQEQAKRYNEYVRTLVELAEAVAEPGEKIEYYTKASELYTGKFSNAAEAIKCNEAILELDPSNASAADYLRQAYEKRRDWDKLIGLMRAEAAAQPDGFDRAGKFFEVAKLANEKVKKPEICVELWNEVIANDPDNPEALEALAHWHERSKDYAELVVVLERQVAITSDPKTQEALLGKLGQYYGDRLNDEESAVGAWQRLLDLNPQDRKAQEALKKKYITLGRWDDLEVFYASTGKWDEFIRTLEAQEAKEEDPKAKIGMLLKTAELWITQKGKADRASRAYEKVLAIDPQHLGAAEALIPIYTEANNSKGLAGAIEVKLSHESDPDAKLALYREVAALYETKLREPELAFERYQAALELSPGDEQCAVDAERAAGVVDGWDKLIASYAVCVARADEDGDVVLAIDLRLRKGRVLLDERKRVDDALVEFRAVYDADSENAEALSALERLYTETERYPELLEVFEKKRDLASDPEDRKQSLYAIASLYQTRLNDTANAIATYVQVLDDEPMDPAALEALDGLYLGQQAWEPYVEVLRKRIELNLTEEQLIDLKLRLGGALEQHLADPAAALENYREVLFLDPSNEAARAALEAQLEQPSLRAESAAILEEIYESRGDWEKLSSALEILAEAEVEPAKQVTILRKIARVAADNLEDVQRAFEAQARALKVDPSDVQTRSELESIAERAQAWDKLDGVFGEIADGLSDAQLARDYGMRLGAIHERLGKTDEAAAGYLRVLSLDPADHEALAAMESLYRRTERYEDLVGVIRRRIELASEEPAREQLYAQMATVYEERLSRPEDAIAAYREVLGFDETSHLALSALDGLFTRQEKWEDLADNLESQLRLAEDEPEQLALMLRLASLRETKMGLVEPAIDIYRDVLDREPTNEQALAALERLGKLADHEVAIAEILEPLYRQSGDFAKLIGVHEVQARRSDDVARKVDLLHQIATLHEDAGADLNSAFDAYARALGEDPASEPSQQGLERLARATERFGDLASVFETLAAKQEDPELASALYTMSARVCESDLGDLERAIAHYHKVLVAEPSNLDAAESLERIFRQAERYAELSATLQQKSEIFDDLADKKAALFQAASIEQDVLERPDAAIAVYHRVLALDSEELGAIDALIKLYLDHSRWTDLLAVYGTKVDLVLDPDDKKRICYQIGAVYERELSDVPKAIDTYQRVLELDPDDLQALGRLDVLYQTQQNWPELLSVLQHEAELASDAQEGISYQYRIAELYEKHLEDTSRAIELYSELLQQMPDHAPTLQALEGLKSSASPEANAAALVLEPIYDATGDWNRLISVLEVQAKATQEAFAKVDLLHRIGRLQEDMLTDHASAFATYARAVEADSADEDSLQNLERLAMAVGQWPRVAELYGSELDKLTSEPGRFVELGLRLAQIDETQLEDIDGAIKRYREVLDVEPENQIAVSSLNRLFTMSERWTDLVGILAREVEIAPSQEDALEFKYRLGQVQQTHLNDLPQAIAAYRDVLASAPDHAPTLAALEGLFAAGVKQAEIGEILEPLYQASGEWEKLAGVLEASLAQLTEPTDRVAMYARLGELHEERLISLDGALAIYTRALKEYPTDEQVLEESERLGGSVDGGWEVLANTYADVLGLHQDKAVQTSIGMRLARVFEDELGDITKAEETYRYVVSVDALQPDALSNLDRIYTSIEQHAELASVLEQRVLATTEPYELIELYGRLGQVYEVELQQPDHAIVAFRKIFDELEPTHQEAIQALERIYQAKGAWSELRVVLDRELENAGGDADQADILAKTAHLLADHLEDVPGAVQTWARVLDLRGDDPEALGALANLHERQGEWAELCEVLERHYDIAPTDEERVAVLLRRAKLFKEQLGRTDSALDDYSRALDIDYANLEALYAVAAIWREREDAREIVSALHQTVDRASQILPPEHLIALYRELGTLYQQTLEQPFDAIDAWRNLLQVDPRDFEAMAALENLLRAEERWVEVVEVKMGRAAAYEGPADKVREYLEVAQIWDSPIEEKDRGTTAYEQILEIEPTHDEAYFALEQLHGAANRSEPLIELYLSRLDTRETVEERTTILRKVAKVFEEQLDDKPQAYDTLLTAFEMDFTDMATVHFLERMTQATNRWAELVQTVNAWLLQQTEPHSKITLCLRLAKWYAEDLGRPEYAQPYYQQILALDPNNVAVLRQMASFFKKGGNWQQQGSTLMSALNVAISDVDRKEILTELGEVLELHMNEPEQGLVHYKRALDVDQLHLPALGALERIYGERNQPHDLVDVLVRKAKALTDPEQVAAVKLRTGGLYETSLGQVEKAGQVYREVLDIDGSNLLAMRGLERVYSTTQQWPDMVGVLEMQLDVVTTERERIDVLSKIAAIQETHFLKPELAAQRFEQIIEIDPNQEDALEGLERCYRSRRQWLDLINTFERHINATLDRQKKIGLWSQTAKVYADEVQDIDRAIDSYLNITDLDDQNIDALDALAKLYEKQDDSSRAIEYMTRVADLTSDGKQRVEMYARIGRQLDEKLGDRIQAQERYEMALDLDPTHLPTLAALRAIALDASEWDRAARYLDQEQMNTEAPRARARLLVELGKLREEMLGEHELSVQAFELALQSDPDNEDAAMPLAAEYVATEQWSRAEPLAEMLAKKSGKRERHEQHALQHQLGKVLAAQGKLDGALKAYQAANHLDLTNQETIRGLADTCFTLGDWPGALTNYQKVLTSLGEEEIDERATIYFKLGAIKQAQGQAKQAINNYEKALALDAAHRPTLDALVNVYDTAHDYKQVCHYKRQILDSVYDGPERFRMLNEIGDIWIEKEKNLPKGVEALEEALDLEPTSHVMLHKLLQLYPQTKQWEPMVDTLQRIADLENAPDRKSRYLYTMAQLYRDKLDDKARAVDLFNEALDLNPTMLEAFERINKVLTEQKDFGQLERSYRKMLHRISGKGNTALEFSLWKALGLIYRDRLGDTEKAIQAFQNGSASKPDDVECHLILAELYETGGQLDGAIAEHQQLLKLDPMNVETYRKLYALYLTRKSYDEAWCLAAVLSFLHQADEEEQQFFEGYKPQGIPQVKSRLDNAQWMNSLFHEEESIHVGKIFEALAKAALKAKIDILTAKKQLPVLDPRFKQDPATSTVTFARTFGWAAQVLGLQAPVLYVRSDIPGGLAAVAADPASSVAGQSVLTGFSQSEITFMVGRHLAMYRGEHYIQNLFSTVTELTIFLFAGIKMVTPDAPVPREIEQQVVATAQQLRGYIQPMELEHLRIAVKKFISDGAKTNIKRWLQCVEVTSLRAGLLLAGDLDAAKKIIVGEPQQPGGLTPQEKMQELLLFSVSEPYFALRETLGVAIVVEG